MGAATRESGEEERSYRSSGLCVPGAQKDTLMLGDCTLLEPAMRRAFDLAARGPAADPNPQVGCVLVTRSGRIVAEGWHRGSGTPHAEVAALAALPAEWRGRERELTAVTTLEPCNHRGRTGPCALALVQANIGAVVYAVADPGDDSAGGAATLRNAGIEVRGGLCAATGRALLLPWLSRRRARPQIIIKWAQTLDGRVAAADGSSQWITGELARADVHRWRAQADAVLIGTGTLYADDPALTARTDRDISTGAVAAAAYSVSELLVPAAHQPIPVVFGHRVIPAGARINRHPALAAHGLSGPLQFSGDDLAAHLAELVGHGIRTLLVEGGARIITSLLAADLVDRLLIYLAPALLGGPRLAVADLGIGSISAMRRLRLKRTRQLGDDLLIEADAYPLAASSNPRKER